jgi:sugar O-acyltransferase (sialic acid O-acetyltransferase NeuD family)
VSERLLILGAGGHAAVVADTARSAGFEVVGHLDDDDGVERLGPIADLPKIVAAHGGCLAVHAAVGCPTLRREWLEVAGELPAPPIVHASAVVSPSATLDEGVLVGPRAVVNARARLGRGVIVNSGAIVEHDCRLDAFCHAAPGSVICGGATIGAAALVGAGAVIVPNVTVGDEATLGAGAVVLDSISAGATVVGVPAR